MGLSIMELALARLVGAGLTLVYEGFEEAVPKGAVTNGLQLIRHIAIERPDVVVRLTQGVVKDIWSEWKHAKLPSDVAVQHLDALPQLMDECRSSDGMMLGAVAAIQVARRIGSAARPISHSSRVATAIIGRSIETGYLNSQGLNESLAFFFLDRLLGRLMPDQQLFFDLRPLFRSYLADEAWRSDQPLHQPMSRAASDPADPAPGPAPDSPTTNEPAGAANAAQLPVPLQDAPSIVEATIAAPGVAGHNFHGGPSDKIAAALSVPLAGLTSLAARAADRVGPLSEPAIESLAFGLRQVLDGLAKRSGDGGEVATLEQRAAMALTSGDLLSADQDLGEVEDLYLRAAQTDLAGAHGWLAAAAATRAMRGELEELAGDFRRAARHYASSARCLPESDRKGRRAYLMRQVGALVAQGEMVGETAALAEAASVYADAGRLLSEQDAPLDWATQHLELGRILMLLGYREGRTERFLAAALHFKPAADVFSGLRETDAWARAQLGLAEALRAQGEVQGDIVILSEAAFSYRATLGIATRDRMPEEWASASYWLAATLLRIDEEGGETSHHEEAVMALRALIGAAPSSDGLAIACSGRVKLASALVALAAARQEPWLEDEALTVMRDAHTIGSRGLDPSVRARLDDDLGCLMAQVGRRRLDTLVIGDAAEMLLCALDHYQSTGEAERAAQIGQVLTALESSVDDMAGRAAAENAAA